MIYPTATPYSKGQVLSLAPYRQIMVTEDGMPISMNGVTAFKLMNLFENGVHADFINTYDASKLFRVFPYVPKKDWGATAWDWPRKEVVADFIRYMNERGKYVFICLLTDDDSSQIGKAIDLTNYLSQFTFNNLLLAAGNEPLTHKNINVEDLYQSLHNSGYLYTSGVYENTHKFYGLFGEDHSKRTDEWPVGAHNCMEAYSGGGPNSPDEPATRVPWFEGEPIKPNDAVGFNNEEQTIKDYYSYAASCTQFGFGGIFHCESAKHCKLPTDFEYHCYDAFNTGLRVFPADTALGHYRRVKEGPGDDVKNHNTLRTYVVGNTMVRHRNKTMECPEDGWKACDNMGVCWTR